jgi:hypothetical protein
MQMEGNKKLWGKKNFNVPTPITPIPTKKKSHMQQQILRHVKVGCEKQQLALGEFRTFSTQRSQADHHGFIKRRFSTNHNALCTQKPLLITGSSEINHTQGNL